jgi:hypothetical protein
LEIKHKTMVNRIKCIRCDNQILETTARKNHGLCAICQRDKEIADRNALVKSWVDHPETLPGTHGIPEPEDYALRAAANEVKHRLYPTYPTRKVIPAKVTPQPVEIPDLPNELLAFLWAGHQLEYDAAKSEIGRITLKRDTDLAVSTITTFPGCQSIIDDPYSDLDGLYQSDVYNLVAESEDYDPEGLLCWIVSLKRFGCIDPEHGDVIMFPDVTWTDIVANPLPYLEAQWGDDHDVAERVLSWIHFPFRVRSDDRVIMPYGSRCGVHDAPVTAQHTSKHPLFDVLRRREIDDWFQNYQTVFPYSGVPLSDDELLCCSQCRAAEDTWIQRIDDLILPLDTTPNAHGWIKCPGCGTRFSLADSNTFKDGMHLDCAQKINVVT